MGNFSEVEVIKKELDGNYITGKYNHQSLKFTNSVSSGDDRR